jgi:LacI family transcriptional regulator, fructose operon transcriptional repressor
MVSSFNRKITIYDIARLSGSSPSTVSAVLNGTWARRRIGEATVELVRKVAAEQGYTTNLQARGLRQARSGLVGMIIPVHDNRFFSSLSQSFDRLARERGMCPVIASTLRNPREEKRIVETLISYAVDSLIIAGATDADSLGDMCTAANLPHAFVDLPGRNAPSVVTDNFRGASVLSRKILGEMPEGETPARARPYFLGGSVSDYATARRVDGFRATVLETGAALADDQIIQCGYIPRDATAAIAELCDRLGGLPAGLFVNSFTVFEGVMGHFVKLPPQAFESSVIGCFDYDPFAAFLQFPVYMVRQNSDQLVAKAYELLESGVTDPIMVQIEPELVAPRTIHGSLLNETG